MSENVFSMYFSQKGIGGCTISKNGGGWVKKEEDEMQYIKEEKGIPRMVKDEIISESNWFRTSFKK